MLKTHNKYRSLSLLLTLGVVVGQLFPVLADDELPTVETIPETEEFDSSGNLGTDDNNGFGEDFGDENPDNDGFGSDDQEPPEIPVTTPEPSAPPVNNSGANPEPPAATEPGENDPTEPVTDPSEQQPQPVTLNGNAEDGKIKVETTTTTAVLPADAFIQADLIKDEQRTAILDGLKDSKYSIDGILPIDIFFLVKNPDSGTADPIPLPEESTVDLKFSVNKDLIHSDKDIDWNSVEVVKVTKNDEGKYEKKTLIENKDLKLVELPVESEPVAPDTDVDQNTEPTEDTDSDPVQKSEPVQTTESGTVTKETVSEDQDPAKHSASSKTEGTTAPETTKETTEFEQVEDADQVEPADVNAAHPDKSPAEPSQAYQGTVTLDGATQIALTWKNKKSSILDEIKDTIDSITEGFKDFVNIFDPSKFDHVTSEDKSTDKTELKDSTFNTTDTIKKPVTGSEADSFIETKIEDEKPEYTPGGDGSATVNIDGSDVTVKVSYGNDTVPANAKLRVKALDADKQADADKELEAADIEYDNALSLDISFVQEDGTEVEPAKEVQVDFKFAKDLLQNDDPEAEVDESSIQIIHHEETNNGQTVPKVIAVSEQNATGEGKGKISCESDNYYSQVTVNSFSTYTFTWSNTWGSDKTKIRFYYYDMNYRPITDKLDEIENISFPSDSAPASGFSIESRIPQTLKNKFVKAVILDDAKTNIAGKDFKEVSTIDYSKTEYESNNYFYYYTVTLKNTSGERVRTINAGESVDVYIILKDYTGTVVSDKVTVYGYAVVPGQEKNVEEGGDAPSTDDLNKFYVGMGIGKVSNVPYQNDAIFGFNYLKSGVEYDPYQIVTYDKNTIPDNQNYLNYPNLWLKVGEDTDKKLYEYLDPTDPQATYEKGKNYYQVRWYTLHVTDGANKNSSDAYGSSSDINDYYKSDVGGNQYHLDGIIEIIKPYYLTVTWHVLGEDGNYHPVQTGALSGKNEDDLKKTLSNMILHTDTSNKYREHIKWYLDSKLKRKVLDTEDVYSLAEEQAGEGNIVSHLDLYAAPYKTVTVTKEVTGNFADRNEEFDFSLTAGNYDNLLSSDDRGFKLRHGGSHSVQVPINATVNVTEADNDYTTTYTIKDSNHTESDPKQGTVARIDHTAYSGKNITVTFTNTKDVPVPSGLSDGNHHAFTLMIAAGLVAMLGLLAAKAYRRMNGI